MLKRREILLAISMFVFAGLGYWILQRTMYLERIKVQGGEVYVNLKNVPFFIQLADSKFQDHHLRYFKTVPTLRVLDLRKSSISDRGLKHLIGSPALSDIRLRETSITNVGLQHLSRIPSLQSLDLSKTNVSDAGLEHFSKHSEIKTLLLHECQQIHFEVFVDAPSLSYLKLHQSSVTDEGLQYIARIPNLHQLDLSETQITDLGLRHLAGHAYIEILNLNQCSQISFEGLRALAPLPNLMKIECHEVFITPDEYDLLSDLFPKAEIETDFNVVMGLTMNDPLKARTGPFDENLVRLSDNNFESKVEGGQGLVTAELLKKIRMKDRVDIIWTESIVADRETLQVLQEFPNLRSLSLDLEVSDEVLRQIGKLSTLESLRITSSETLSGLTQQGIRELSGLTHLEFLTLHLPEANVQIVGGFEAILARENLRSIELKMPLNDRLLEQLGKLSKLNTIHLTGSQKSEEMTAVGLEHLSRLNNLNSLTIQFPNANPRVFSVLGTIPNLHRLTLQNAHLSDHDILFLENLRTLEFVNLDDNELTVKSVDLLAQHPALSYASVYQNQIDEESIPQLPQMLSESSPLIGP